MIPPLHLALVVDATNLHLAATTLASVCRRTRRAVEVRCYVRNGELPDDIRTENLTVVFILDDASARHLDDASARHLDETNVRHLEADVLQSITNNWLDDLAQATDWGRCWLLQAGQLVLTDLAELDQRKLGDGSLTQVGTCTPVPSRNNAGQDKLSLQPRPWAGEYHIPDMLSASGSIGGCCSLPQSTLGAGKAVLLDLEKYRQHIVTGLFDSSMGLEDRLDGCSIQVPASMEWAVTAGEGNSFFSGDLEWEHPPPAILSWMNSGGPSFDPMVPGAQLWLRETADWEDLVAEVAYRETDRTKSPVWVIHLARVGLRNTKLLDSISDAGFRVELLRGCDQLYPVEFNASIGLLLQWFGLPTNRRQMARALSHRWAWQAFIQQSDHPFAIFCEDDSEWNGTNLRLRDSAHTLRELAWILDLGDITISSASGPSEVKIAPDGSPVNCSRYCLSRKGAEMLLELDCRIQGALVSPQNPVPSLRHYALPGDANSPRFLDNMAEFPSFDHQPYSTETVGESANRLSGEYSKASGGRRSPCQPSPNGFNGQGLVDWGVKSMESCAASISPRLLIGVCSCQGNDEKRNAVRSSWFPKDSPEVCARFFVGAGDDAPLDEDTVVLNVPDDYEHLPIKIFEFFRYAINHLDFDYIFKCDDDTFVVPERVYDLMENGVDYVGNEFILNRGAADGGAGYLLSHRVIEKIVADTSLDSTGNEDIIVGEAAIRHGAVAKVNRNLVWDISRIPRWDNQVISCHRMTPRLMALAAAINQVPLTSVCLNLPEWRDQILLYEGGYFSRKSVHDYGCWSWDPFSNELLLDWLNGEVLRVIVGESNQVVCSTWDDRRACAFIEYYHA